MSDIKKVREAMWLAQEIEQAFNQALSEAGSQYKCEILLKNYDHTMVVSVSHPKEYGKMACYIYSWSTMHKDCLYGEIKAWLVDVLYRNEPDTLEKINFDRIQEQPG